MVVCIAVSGGFGGCFGWVCVPERIEQEARRRREEEKGMV
jgi:hypothetical protein